MHALMQDQKVAASTEAAAADGIYLSMAAVAARVTLF
jgi:hypothetical protein